jgi:hypothetical protein
VVGSLWLNENSYGKDEFYMKKVEKKDGSEYIING